MARGSNEPLYIQINQKLGGHAYMDSLSCSIFKVPNPLREINEKAYEPQVISIGPYHYGKEHLKAMEVHKMNSLKSLLDQTGENSVEKYVTALRNMEDEARKIYSEPLGDIAGNILIEMMLLDGCFIIELLFESTVSNRLTDFHLGKIMRDLLLIENQLPFSVLCELYSLSSGQPLDTAKHCVADKAISFYNKMMPGSPINEATPHQDVKHLLGLLHLFYSSEQRPVSIELGILPRSSAPAVPESSPRQPSPTKRKFIHYATKLEEAGIKFQKNGGRLFHIEFRKGVMSIPTLEINDDTESIFRNLVAYEQCYKGISSKCFTNYVIIMDRLINTGKDVELLCHHGVLQNWLGDHEVVATMFNRLCDCVSISDTDLFYSEIFEKVNEHCNRKWNLWKANLWHNYFNSPWALISFIAAVFLLLFAMLQALFSVLSYNK
ncbi:hypothetical protein SLA2020_506400 [Shorea laevis]